MKDVLKSSDRTETVETGLLPVGTLVMWLACVVVGLIGLFWPRLPAPAKPPVETQMDLVSVDITNHQPPVEPSPPAANAPPSDVAAPPDMPPVVAPNPSIVFAQPVNAPVTPRLRAAPAAVTQPAVIDLTLGEGEGDQPAPDYPVEAALAGQEGTVTVRLSVDEDGLVTDVEIVTPSHWPLLNSAAVRAVRTTWRFRRGAARVYRVAIQFHINRNQ